MVIPKTCFTIWRKSHLQLTSELLHLEVAIIIIVCASNLREDFITTKFDSVNPELAHRPNLINLVVFYKVCNIRLHAEQYFEVNSI